MANTVIGANSTALIKLVPQAQKTATTDKVKGFFRIDALADNSSFAEASDGVGQVSFHKTETTLKAGDKITPFTLVELYTWSTSSGGQTRSTASKIVAGRENAVQIAGSTTTQQLSLSGMYDYLDDETRKIVSSFTETVKVSSGGSNTVGKAIKGNEAQLFLIAFNKNAPDTEDIRFEYRPLILSSITKDLPEENFVEYSIEGAVQGTLFPRDFDINAKVFKDTTGFVFQK